MSLSLYKLSKQFQDVLEFEVNGQEDADAMLALLDEVQDSVEDKIGKIGHVITTLRYEAEAIREEEKSLAEKRKARESKVKSLMDYTFATMKSLGIVKVEAIDRTVRIQKNPPSLKIVDEAAIPAEFWVPQDPKLDTMALKDFVKKNECDYAFLDQSESLRVQ